jgi:hypothetical protein
MTVVDGCPLMYSPHTSWSRVICGTPSRAATLCVTNKLNLLTSSTLLHYVLADCISPDGYAHVAKPKQASLEMASSHMQLVLVHSDNLLSYMKLACCLFLISYLSHGMCHGIHLLCHMPPLPQSLPITIIHQLANNPITGSVYLIATKYVTSALADPNLTHLHCICTA